MASGCEDSSVCMVRRYFSRSRTWAVMSSPMPKADTGLPPSSKTVVYMTRSQRAAVPGCFLYQYSADALGAPSSMARYSSRTFCISASSIHCSVDSGTFSSTFGMAYSSQSLAVDMLSEKTMRWFGMS